MTQQFAQINQQFNQANQQTNQQFNQIAQQLNDIQIHLARTSSQEYQANGHVSVASHRIHWWNNPQLDGGAALPETKADFLTTNNAALTQICEAYNLSIVGTAYAKRRLIAHHIGLVI